MRASDDLSAQLARSESLNAEFKAWPIPPDDLAATIVAFANTGGGRVFLGVDDLGIAAGGVGEPGRPTQFVDNVAFNNCSPPVTVLPGDGRDRERHGAGHQCPEGRRPPLSDQPLERTSG